MPTIRLTLMIYLIGYMLGEFPYGPIGNHIGRKNGIYLGGSIAMVGTILCLLSWWVIAYWLLLVGLFLIALGCACGMSLAMAIIGDTYDEEHASHLITRLVLTFAVMPAISVVLGGYLVADIGWWSCFVAELIYLIVVTLYATRLPRTVMPGQFKPINIKILVEEYAVEFKNSGVVIPALIMSIATTFVYYYAALSPFVGILHLKLSPHEYGLWSLIPYAGLALSSILSPLLLRKVSHYAAIVACGIITFFIILAMFLCFEFGEVTMFTLFGLYFLIYLFLSVIISSSSIAISNSNNKATVGAVTSGINMFLSVVGAIIFSLVSTSVLIILPAAILATSIIMLILILLLKSRLPTRP
jgi:MFS family permease